MTPTPSPRSGDPGLEREAGRDARPCASGEEEFRVATRVRTCAECDPGLEREAGRDARPCASVQQEFRVAESRLAAGTEDVARVSDRNAFAGVNVTIPYPTLPYLCEVLRPAIGCRSLLAGDFRSAIATSALRALYSSLMSLSLGTWFLN